MFVTVLLFKFAHVICNISLLMPLCSCWNKINKVVNN